MIRLVLPKRGMLAAMSSSRSTYSTPATIACRRSISRVFLVFCPAAAVLFAAAGDDHRAGPLGQEPLEIRRRHQEVEPQLDQLAALLGQVLVLGDQMPMPAAADGDAEQG